MAATAPEPSSTDVVIVGNGPSALLLSYILHGNIPFYNPRTPHPDPILHEKLKDAPKLLDLDVDKLTDHFEASRYSYSTQALPLNSLLDSLARPNADTDDTERNTCLEWRHLPEAAVPHVVLGDAPRPGGQWTECPKRTTWDIQSLSYAGMLSLPGYSFAEYHQDRFGSKLPPFTRPSRREIADYYTAYPAAVGISDSVRSAETVANISRTDSGFYIASHNLSCKFLVLASGIFTEPKPARPLLQPLLDIPASRSTQPAARNPLLVIGSGFSAADAIISAPKDQKIIHIFKWDDKRPSPLKACHQQAYPEYAGIYRLMKRSSSANLREPSDGRERSWLRPASLTPFLKSREWASIYEGLPNTLVTDTGSNDKGAVVTLQLQDGTILQRQVSGLAYAVGRQGSLEYLDESVRSEVIPGDDKDSITTGSISASTLRNAALADLEVARNIFIIGSLTGDSLIRFAYGGCVYVAGKLVSRETRKDNGFGAPCHRERPKHMKFQPDGLMNGLDGHNDMHNDDNRQCHDVLPAGSPDIQSPRFPGLVWAKGKSWWNVLFSW
ncbi:uncharacterized protein CIMG_02996 [Coccidioides immitis RS]|uniref:uncharacterized protein n=1 Tax=Coccidioides immitis (strain RS) TaxID=246410 RepID=UPI0000D86A44|nr:uncharacterized protein CIMG_02996 [Coccidioides immitis RS]EAS31972.3 hypothetical protein CIMG_02996 [Coccidioides immitis RS]